jgi:hypothetical protein
LFFALALDSGMMKLARFSRQAGARPFSFDGKQTVKVDLASDQAKSVEILG